jgi:hypothetical protein
MTNPSWAPKRLADLKGMKVKGRRDFHNGYVSIPRGTVLTIGGSTRWNGIGLSGPKCSHCGIEPYICGVDIHDLEPAES